MSSMPMRDMKRELRRDEKTKIAAVLDKVTLCYSRVLFVCLF